MKSMFFFTVLPVLVLLSSSFISLAAEAPNGLFTRYTYNPAYDYPGIYSKNLLYYKNPGNPNWQLGFGKDLSAVSCIEAYNNLRSTGTWKGHLRQNGSCADPAEGVDWKSGNRLNFDATIVQTGK